MTSCDRCNRPSVTYLRYSGQHLCSVHYLDLLRRRIGKELRKQKFKPRGTTIGLALSGGKDSVLMTRLLWEIVRSVKSAKLVALSVDEGISDYRPTSMEIAKGITRDLGIDHDIFSFREDTGHDLDDLVERTNLSPCGICGILRRKALNVLAARNHCDIICTGHNLDDYAQTVMMNVLSADLDRMARLGPHERPLPGFVPRLMPLRSTPENETYLAALLMGLPIHDRECPYSIDVRRARIRDLVLLAEESQPGARHSLLNFQDKVRPLVPRTGSVSGNCGLCGEPIFNDDGGKMCKACRVISDILVR